MALYPTNETYIDEVENSITLQSPKKGGLKIVKKVEKPVQKVLYIDDEFSKGWEDIFQTFFDKKHKQEFQFTTIKDITKDSTFEQLKSSMIEHINRDTPDIILLDLRLTKEDHQEKEYTNISGIKLLKYIKGNINPGIQVILLTASGKSQIINEANKYDILGYIKKEHPQDGISNTKESFSRLKVLLEDGLQKQYLKKIWNIQQDILNLNIFNSTKYNAIKLEIISVFEVLNSKMQNRFIYSMFAIFKVLESIVKLYIEEKKDNKKRYAYWINTNDKIPNVDNNNFLKKTTSSDKNDSTENKIRVILHEKLNIKDKLIHDKISNIVYTRNHIIHPNKTKVSIGKDNIVAWFTNLSKILTRIDKKEKK